MRGGDFGHPAGLHFHGGSPASPQKGLFGGSLSYMVDGRQHARRVRDLAIRQSHVEPAACGIHCRGHENIADFQRRIQRATESHTDNHFRPARLAGYLYGPAGMRRARAIRHHP